MTPLKVITLNQAHGRGTAAHQIFLSRQQIKTNLQRIIAVVKEENPHLLAIQEADAPSIWTGNFDHVHFLKEACQFQYSFHGVHMNTFGLQYGTALLSKHPLLDCHSVRFSNRRPLPPKGFIKATVSADALPNGLDVISAHLDFLSHRVRSKQIESIIHHCTPQQRPLVVMGDFNCDWGAKDSAIKRLCKRLDLKPFSPLASELHTFWPTRRRWDWILVSQELSFVNYRTLADRISDHGAVCADLTGF